MRYAVVGLGHIAQTAILPAFEHASSNSELVALVSGDKTKRNKLGKAYGVSHTFDYADYQKLLNSGMVDAVYISLPNDMHARFTIEALQAGVHVLCEKPLAMNAEDAKVMAQVSEQTGIKLMTAYRLHFSARQFESFRTRQVRSARRRSIL